MDAIRELLFMLATVSRDLSNAEDIDDVRATGRNLSHWVRAMEDGLNGEGG